MNGAQPVRQAQLELLTGVLQAGMDAGALRVGDARLIALAMIGSGHWSWTRHDPDGASTP
jgi:hypothetical protein